MTAMLLSSATWAHKVIVFAYMEGDMIVAEAGFPGGAPAKNTAIELQAAETGAVLASGTTDTQGLWRTPLPPSPPREGLLVVLNAGEGHRAQWRLAPEEYLQHAGESSSSVPQPTTGAIGKSGGQESSSSEAASNERVSSCIEGLSQEDLEKQISQAVSRAIGRELAPLRRQLLQSAEPDLRDILGGIGYLLGLAGLFAYARSRKP